MRKRWRSISRLVLLCFVGLCWSGCDDPQPPAPDQGLQSCQDQLATLEAQNAADRRQYRELQRRHQALTFEYANTLQRHEELNAWSQALVAGHGAGVWYFSEWERPLFVKKVVTESVRDILTALNALLHEDGYPEVYLQRVADRTAYVTLSDEQYLTQRMGTAGAESYLMAVTYSLASLTHIDCVAFDFKAGEHAIPGLYCR